MPAAEDRPGNTRSAGDQPEPAPLTAAQARAAVEATRAARSDARAQEMWEAFPGTLPGRPTMWASWVATIALIGVSLAALFDPDALLGTFFVVTFVLFLLGAGLFAVVLVLAAARSTTHLMGIGGIFFLIGSAPRAVQFSLNGSLALAVAASVTIVVLGWSTPELAFGTLSPLLELSFTGLWGIRHGHFPERADG